MHQFEADRLARYGASMRPFAIRLSQLGPPALADAFVQERWESRLCGLSLRQPVVRPASACLQEVLAVMQQLRVGSVLLTDGQGLPVGILTRGDVLDRVTLAGLPLQTSASAVMTQPVLSVDGDASALDAALLMVQHGLRHLPVMQTGRLLGLVSEHDLFALQSQSVAHISGAIARAADSAQWRQAADQIRRLTRQLLVQGLQSQPMTRLISRLNDKLTRRVIDLTLERHGLSHARMCWLALGSEGRGEQTIASDQDNALIFESDDPRRDKTRWLAFACDVNLILADCGFPLCTGAVMASNPQCCLTLDQWSQRFADWIEHGSAQELLKASVFFDLRALAGRLDWADRLGQQVARRVVRTPRFIQQWALNHMAMPEPLNWYRGLRTQRRGGRAKFNIKLSGTGLLVDAARILALSQGVQTPSTQERFEQAGRLLNIPLDEYRGWITAFDHLQQLRLDQQIRASDSPDDGTWVAVDALDQVNRRMLKASLLAIRGLRQRLTLDYLR